MKKYLLFNTDKFRRQGLFKGVKYEILSTNEYQGVFTFLNNDGAEKQVSTDYVMKSTDITLLKKKGNYHLF